MGCIGQLFSRMVCSHAWFVLTHGLFSGTGRSPALAPTLEERFPAEHCF
jgi:hypothetical protein